MDAFVIRTIWENTALITSFSFHQTLASRMMSESKRASIPPTIYDRSAGVNRPHCEPLESRSKFMTGLSKMPMAVSAARARNCPIRIPKRSLDMSHAFPAPSRGDCGRCGQVPAERMNSAHQ